MDIRLINNNKAIKWKSWGLFLITLSNKQTAEIENSFSLNKATNYTPRLCLDENGLDIKVGHFKQVVEFILQVIKPSWILFNSKQKLLNQEFSTKTWQ